MFSLELCSEYCGGVQLRVVRCEVGLYGCFCFVVVEHGTKYDVLIEVEEESY